jgi:hypothetical protein
MAHTASCILFAGIQDAQHRTTSADCRICCADRRYSTDAEKAANRAVASSQTLVDQLRTIQLAALDMAPQEVKDSQWYKDFRTGVNNFNQTGKAAAAWCCGEAHCSGTWFGMLARVGGRAPFSLRSVAEPVCAGCFMACRLPWVDAFALTVVFLSWMQLRLLPGRRLRPTASLGASHWTSWQVWPGWTRRASA